MLANKNVNGYLPIDDTNINEDGEFARHSHVFVGKGQHSAAFRTKMVICLCFASMVIEIVCGTLFGSLALVADGIHMSTHCIAFFITAFAYSYAHKHRNDKRFVFGTGKVSELAAFSSAIILILIALIILWEGLNRLFHPQPLHYKQALPIAFIGLSVNVASGLLLAFNFCDSKPNSLEGDDKDGLTAEERAVMDHGHSHGHQNEKYEYDDHSDGDDENECSDGRDHGHDHHAHDSHAHDSHHAPHGSHGNGSHEEEETFRVATSMGTIVLSIFEDGVPPEFRIRFENWKSSRIVGAADLSVTTVRKDEDGCNKQEETFQFKVLTHLSAASTSVVYHSTTEIPEPHEFQAILSVRDQNTGKSHTFPLEFKEHADTAGGHDHSHSHATNRNDHTQAQHIDHVNVTSLYKFDQKNDHNRDHGHEHQEHGSSYQNLEMDHGHDHGHRYSHNNHVSLYNFDDHSGHDHSHAHGSGSHHDHDIEQGGHSHNDHHSYQQPAAVKTKTAATSAGAAKKYDIDNNYRAAIIHVVADAFVSVLVIIALLVAGHYPQFAFLDPLVGIIGSVVILSWGYVLLYDTSSNLLDMNPDQELCVALRKVLERDGDTKVLDLHVWRLGPGHLGCVLSVRTSRRERDEAHYRSKMRRFKALSHVTIEVVHHLATIRE